MTDIQVDKLPCCIVVFNNKAIIELINDTACALLQYSKAELIGKPVDTILTISSRIFLNTHFFPLLKMRGRAEEIFFHVKDSAGKHIPVLVNAMAEENQYTCTFSPVWQRSKFEDELIAARKEAEKALHENVTLNKLSEELELQIAQSDKHIAMLNYLNGEYMELNKITSHDLNEPIRKIHIDIDRLQHLTADTGNTSIGPLLHSLSNAADRLKGLAFTLQQYVSMDVNRDDFKTIQLRDCISNANRRVQKELDFGEYFLRLDILNEIEGSQTLIERMFYELIHNCVKFRDTQRELTINIQAVTIQENSFITRKEKYHYKDYVRISISDNGIGFPDQYADQVFAMYKKLHTNMPGYGFGLALVKKIVILHQGHISLHSSPGVGVKVVVTLPVKQGM